MTGSAFDDRRSFESSRLAAEADAHLRHAHRVYDQRAADPARLAEAHERVRAACELYRQAAALETQLADETPPSSPRIRGLLALSAAALWTRAGERDEALRVARRFLADPALLPEARGQLQEMIAPSAPTERTADALGLLVFVIGLGLVTYLNISGCGR